MGFVARRLLASRVDAPSRARYCDAMNVATRRRPDDENFQIHFSVF